MWWYYYATTKHRHTKHGHIAFNSLKEEYSAYKNMLLLLQWFE
jgi:hypothetical protein